VQYLGEMGAEVEVRRNDQVTVEEVEAMRPERIVVSPGPCTPREAGISIDLIRHFTGKVPVLGVCLGHQAIGEAFGGTVIRAPHLMHGKTSEVQHDGKTIFEGLSSPMTSTRYHSLIVRERDLPADLEVSAWTTEKDGSRTIIPRLSYTERVIKEATRLYPPGWAVARTALRNCEVGGYQLRRGDNIVVSQWCMHRDARFFFDPLKFDPDRWSPERAQSVPKYAYFPFGAGPRGCVGQSFATMEAILLLATISQQFRFSVVPDHPVVPMPSVTLRPKHGIRMVLHRR